MDLLVTRNNDFLYIHRHKIFARLLEVESHDCITPSVVWGLRRFLALLLLSFREALDRPLVFVLTEGEGMDMREVEVLWDSLVDISDGVAFFVLGIGSQLQNEDKFQDCQ